MKAHTHRLLKTLSNLAGSSLAKEVYAVFGPQTVGPVLEAKLDLHSLHLCTRFNDNIEEWSLYDRDAITAIRVSIDVAACKRAGIDPQLDAVMEHLEGKRASA